MKTAISLPDEVFRAVDAQAKRLQLSRSEFFVRAVMRMLRDLEEERVTASYNEAYAEPDAKDASFEKQAARNALLAVDWDET
jgi:metal-responsive CopG/Arc/MetJ family transcriptional regulator